MKRAWFLLLLFVPSVFAAVPENFDADTVGADPSDGRYTYVEDGVDASVSASGFTGNGFQYPGSGSGQNGVYFEWADENLCSPGAIYSARFQPDTDSVVGDQWPIVAFTENVSSGFSISANRQGSNSVEIRSERNNLNDYPTHAGGLQASITYDAWVDDWNYLEVSEADCSVSNEVTYHLKMGNSTALFINQTINQVGTYTVTNLNQVWHGFRTTAPAADAEGVLFDSLQWGALANETAPTAPTAPTGLSGFVKESYDAVDGARVVIRWPLSSNDPERDTGNFTYSWYVDGVYQSDDPITAADGLGTREREFTSDPGFAKEIVVQVRALNATTGELSPLSCSIILDLEIQFSQDSCGTNAPSLAGVGGGGGIIPGVDKDQIADDLGIDRTAWDWILGASITFGIVAAVWRFSESAMLAGAGGLFGVGISTAFGLFPLWFILVLVLFGAAALFLRRS